jgi:hypothetical protein
MPGCAPGPAAADGCCCCCCCCCWRGSAAAYLQYASAIAAGEGSETAGGGSGEGWGSGGGGMTCERRKKDAQKESCALVRVTSFPPLPSSIFLFSFLTDVANTALALSRGGLLSRGIWPWAGRMARVSIALCYLSPNGKFVFFFSTMVICIHVHRLTTSNFGCHEIIYSRPFMTSKEFNLCGCIFHFPLNKRRHE